MRFRLVCIFLLELNCFIQLYSQHNIVKCNYHFFNESANLQSKTITDIYIDSLHQMWVVNNGIVQFFNGRVFNDVHKANNFRLGAIADVHNGKYFVRGDTQFYKLNIFSRKLSKHIRGQNISNKELLLYNNLGDNVFISNFKNKEISPISANLSTVVMDNRICYTSNNILTMVNLLSNDTIRRKVPFDLIFDRFKLIGDNIFYIDKDKRLKVYKIKQHNIVSSNIIVQGDINFVRMDIVKDQKGKYLLGLNKNLYELDDNFQIAKEFRTFDNKPFLKNGYITKLITDKFNNIYAATLFEGLLKVDNQENFIRYFGSGLKENQFSKCIFADKSNNRIIIGTWGSGLQVYDTLTNLKYTITQVPGLKESLIVSHITKINNHEYLCLLFGQKYFFKLVFSDNYKCTLVKLGTKTHSTQFDINETFLTAEESILSAGYVAYHLKRKNGDIAITEIIKNGSQYYFSGSSTNDHLIFCYESKLDVYNKETYQFLKTESLPLPEIICLAQKSANEIYLGTQKGLVVYNVETNKQYFTSFADGKVYSIQKDKNNKLWLGTSTGIYMFEESGTSTWLSIYDGLQDWEFNRHCSALASDGEIYFGGIYGTNSFYSGKIDRNKSSISFIDGVYSEKVNYNTRYFENRQFNFPYKTNIIRIKLGVLGSKLPDVYNKQYKIEGLSEQWINLKTQDEIAQVLPSGTHKIYYRISDRFEPNALPSKYIKIVVSTPFFLKWWFWAGCFLALGALVIYLFNTYKNLQFGKTTAEWQAKESLLKERSRISKELHDFIGAQLSIISRNINWIKDNKNKISETILSEKLDQINALSSKTNADIRDTIWATKMQSISLEELIVRLKNFSYSINNEDFIVEFKNQCPNMQLSSTIAINLLRICQEALINALKYSNAHKVLVKIYSEDNHAIPHIQIIDQGIGFDTNKASIGNGLMNMKERAEEIYYHLSIQSNNEGTQILLTPKST